MRLRTQTFALAAALLFAAALVVAAAVDLALAGRIADLRLEEAGEQLEVAEVVLEGQAEGSPDSRAGQRTGSGERAGAAQEAPVQG
jgi:hypothetical protein